MERKIKQKLFGNLSSAIPILWGIVIVISLLEVFTYEGFILKHFGIDSKIIYILFGFIELFGLFKPVEEKSRFVAYFRKVNFILMLILVGSYVVLSFVEIVTYNNFVFSTIHVNIKALIYPVLLSVYTGFVLVGLKFVIFVILLLFLGFLLENNLSKVWAKNMGNILNVFKNPDATYTEKMENSLGKQFYDYVIFVKENTPDSSTLLIPPQGYPWPQSGNIPYMRYFLYPRILLNGMEYSPNHDLNKAGIDYVLLDWGETVAVSGTYTHGWPKFDVSAEEIIFWERDGKLTIKKGDYFYNRIKGQELWGIIKVKK